MSEVPFVTRRSFLRGSAALAGGAGIYVATEVASARPAVAAPASPGDPGDIPVSNVRDFGATGNGVTDDTAAIQAAIHKTSADGGGVVYLPTGTYAITGISLATGVDLLGATRNSSVLLFTPTSGDAISLSKLSFNHLATFQIRFAHSVTSGAAIHLDGCFTIKVSDIYVNGGGSQMGYDGIYVDQSTAIFISHFRLSGLTHAGVRIAGPIGNDVYIAEGVVDLLQANTGTSVLVENYANGAVNITDAELLHGQYAMLIKNSNYMRFENTYFDSSAEGVVIESGNLLTFTNCWFSNRPGSGLTIGAAHGVSVIGGQAVNCGANGIHIRDGAHYAMLNGVQVVGNNDGNVGADGILVDGSNIESFSIVGCAVGNDSQAAVMQTVGQEIGIHVTSAVVGAEYTITNNILFDNRVQGLVDDGQSPNKYVVGNVGNRGPGSPAKGRAAYTDADPVVPHPSPEARAKNPLSLQYIQ